MSKLINTARQMQRALVEVEVCAAVNRGVVVPRRH